MNNVVRSGLGLLVLCLVAPWAAGDDGPARGVLVRDLGRLPASTWQIEQSYVATEKATVEGSGAEETSEAQSGTTVRFRYGLDLRPPANADGLLAVATVRSIRLLMEGKDTHVFDSEGEPAGQSPVLARQFGRLAGRTAQVKVAAFAEGEGFQGLDEALAAPPGERSPSEKTVASNRRNFGDARLDRLLCRGLTLLFGPEAGRAHGRTRALQVGEEFEVTLEVPGIGGKATPTKHAVRVTAVGDGLAVVRAHWHVNGFDPEIRDDGSILMRGGDLQGEIEATFRLEGGLAVRWREEITRVDQVSNGATQRTWRRHSLEEVAIVPAPAPPAAPAPEK